MNAIQERAVRMCFEGDILQSLVLNVLRIHKEHKPRETPRVTPLEVLSIQSIMAAKLKDNVEGLVIYSLVFGELVNLYNFTDKGPIDKEFLGASREQMRRMRTDAELMLAMMEHSLDRFSCEDMVIRVGKKQLEIEANYMWLAYPPNRNGKKYDTYWALKFIRLALSKDIETVHLMMNGPHILDNYMEVFMERLISKLRPVIPPEGWKEAIENGNKPIYRRWDSIIEHGQDFSAIFNSVKWYSDSVDYWGYLNY